MVMYADLQLLCALFGVLYSTLECITFFCKKRLWLLQDVKQLVMRN